MQFSGPWSLAQNCAKQKANYPGGDVMGAIQDLDADEMLMRIEALGNSIELLKSLHAELIETYQQKYEPDA